MFLSILTTIEKLFLILNLFEATMMKVWLFKCILLSSWLPVGETQETVFILMNDDHNIMHKKQDKSFSVSHFNSPSFFDKWEKRIKSRCEIIN